MNTHPSNESASPARKLVHGLIFSGATLLALVLLPSLASADGLVVIHPTPDLPDPTALAVQYHHVDIDIRDQVSHVRIDQVFHNPNGRELEGEYLFPVPDGAAVSDFALYVDGEPVHAEAMDADRALAIYEGLVRQWRDPALLEYAGREVFRARIFPFPAHGDRRVALQYDQLIAREGGLYRFVYPLSTEKFSSRPLESAYVKITLEADRPIASAYCPTHDVDIERIDRRHLRVTWEESGVTPDRDLVLFYGLAEGPMDIRVLPYRPDDGADGYFMLLAAPGGLEEMPVTPKDVVFVIDHSGSMRGTKIEQAREALTYCLKHLNADDRFDIVSFSTEIDAFAGSLVPANGRQVRRAVEFAQNLEADGGTNIAGALDAALDLAFATERAGYVIFLTDGLPTEGERDPERILAQVARRNRGRGVEDDGGGVRIFPFGLGYDVNAVLLDQLAADNSGSPTYVRETEDLQARVRSFYDAVADPVLTDIRLLVDGARLRDLQPSSIPDVFRGGQLVLFGRYRGTGPIDIELTGRVNGHRRQFHASVDLPAWDEGNVFVGRLWATRRVGTLLRTIRLHGEEPELVEEIKGLGVRFGIATPYTSFLVDEDAIREATRPLADAQPAPSWGALRTLADRASNRVGGKGRAHDAGAPSVTAAPPAPAQMMAASSGQMGFEVSKKVEAMAAAESEERSPGAADVRIVNGTTFSKDGEVWKPIDCPKDVRTTKIKIGDDAYFKLLKTHREVGRILALGERVIFQLDGHWYETVS
jgi:Ca-activated chloride channel family protein